MHIQVWIFLSLIICSSLHSQEIDTLRTLSYENYTGKPEDIILKEIKRQPLTIEEVVALFIHTDASIQFRDVLAAGSYYEDNPMYISNTSFNGRNSLIRHENRGPPAYIPKCGEGWSEPITHLGIQPFPSCGSRLIV